MGFDLLMTSQNYRERRLKLWDHQLLCVSLGYTGPFTSQLSLPLGEVSFVFFFRASAAPFVTTDSGPVRMDSSYVSSYPGRVSSSWVPCFYFI
ncbi:hypothetical protein TNCV_1915021 [Trichonephila clavipes]|uniref:Uncharacterized protein n=1 Tax=Trichonephila clavipes TaxID=2585209 RepID=A0A8X6W0G0_TRICX|nr:hypothetical protein TNCV_1915021 [Trichonephila clavipes]